MITIQVTIPEFLANQAADAAEKEQTTGDNIIAIALSSQIETSETCIMC